MSTHYLDNYYARLGIPKDASANDIQRAYRRAARRLHPDTNQAKDANEVFLQIQEAYEVLSSPSKRKNYDAALPEDIDSPPALMINAIYSCSQISAEDGQQTVYVLMDLMASPSEEEQQGTRPPMNVALVLDSSTSMAGRRLNHVIQAAGDFVAKLQSSDILSIVTFDDSAQTLVEAGNDFDDLRVKSQLSQIQTSGGTEILQGLQAGFKQVAKKITPNFINHLILFTDGRTYGDEPACLQLAEQAAKRGISISAIGIGEEWNENFIEALVAKSGGNSFYAAGSADIPQILDEVFANLSQVFASNVVLDFELGPYSNLENAFRLNPEPSSIPPASPLNLGGVLLQNNLSLLLEFSVAPPQDAQGELVLAEGYLQLDLPARPIPASRARFSLTRPVGNLDREEAQPQVLTEAIAKLSIFRLQEEAHSSYGAGDSNASARQMRTLATHLLSAGDRKLAKTVLHAAEEIQAGRSLDEKSGKQIKYGTRALIMPPNKER